MKSKTAGQKKQSVRERSLTHVREEIDEMRRKHSTKSSASAQSTTKHRRTRRGTHKKHTSLSANQTTINCISNALNKEQT